MKKSIFLFLALLTAASLSAFAQKESEFTIGLSESEIEVKPGESREVTVNLTRSRGYSKSKVKLGVSSTLPKGITVSYEPQSGQINASIARITVSPETPAGTYVIVPNGVMNYISKGVLLKVSVPEISSTVTKVN
jgi:uncharacterized protein (DUF58 family)